MWPQSVRGGLCGSLSPVLREWWEWVTEQWWQSGRSKRISFFQNQVPAHQCGKGAVNLRILAHVWFTNFRIFYFYRSQHLISELLCLSILTRSFFDSLPLSVSLSFSWRFLAVSPVEKPPTHGASGSQLSKTPKLLTALNRSPTQHHYLLQLHKCRFPTAATPHKLHTPICTRHSSASCSKPKHLQENVLAAHTCVQNSRSWSCFLISLIGSNGFCNNFSTVQEWKLHNCQSDSLSQEETVRK